MSQVLNHNLPDSAIDELVEEDEVFVFPASFAQQRLWFLDQFEPNSPFYNIPLAVRLTGQLDLPSFERSLNEIVRRHETLRTTFATMEGRPVQVIAPPYALDLPLVDLSVLPDDQREAQALRLATEEARRPFDLARGPLLRTQLLRLTEQEHIVLLTMHHIISDGWSMGVLIGEVAAIYAAFARGYPSPLPELPIQYADFADWQRGWFEDGDGDGESPLQKQLDYWKNQLRGAQATLELPADRPRPAVQIARGASESLLLPRALAESLNELSQREGATLFMTLLAAFQALLYRYSGQEDICVGTPIANRTRAEIEPLIGFFVNTLVLRGDLAGNPSFRTLLRQVREIALEAYAHQDLPFEMLVEAIQPERDMSRNPLFQVMFILQNAPVKVHRLPDMTMRMLDVDSGAATFDLTLSMAEQTHGLSASLEYNIDLFNRDTIVRMLGHLQTLLEGIVADPDRPIATLPLLTAAEQRQLVDWSVAASSVAPDCCVHELFAAQAERQPAAIAITWAGEHVSYAELNRRANQLAHYLRRQGVGPETLVAICADRSIEVIVAVLGVLKAGGTYVPLDPSYPVERLAFMLDDAQPAALITTDATAQRLSGSAVQRLINLDTDWPAIAQEPERDPERSATLDNLAYVIYTSGSTGQSKGVMITHRSLANAYLAWEDAYALTLDDCHLQMASFSFDVFAGDLVRALCSGGRLLLCPRELLLEAPRLYALMAAERVTCAEFVPAVLRGLMQYLDQSEQKLDSMHLLICGSDSWYVSEYRQFQRRCGPATRLINSFGLTEATIDSTYFEQTTLSLSADQLVPIGRPFANTEIQIVDQFMQPTPIGVPGELCIGGVGVARGYLNRPELTTERFITNPNGPMPVLSAAEGRQHSNGPMFKRFYRTGDRARYLADGNIEFLGRIDHQVKIRGFRIEPGEIEAVLARHSSVREAVVVPRADAPGGLCLAAYLVARGDGAAANPDTASLRMFLADRLPDYMIPAAFVTLEQLPLTPNGKVDRQNLPAPDWTQRELENAFVAPRTPVEELLAGIYTQVLGIETVGVYDNFFALGGHSLLATQLVSRVRDSCQIELPLRVAFEAPNVAELAERVEILQRTSAGTQAPPLQPAPRDGLVPLSFAQQRLWFLDQLEPGSPFYNIPETVRLTGPLDLATLERCLREIVRRHENLRTTFVTVDGRPHQVIAPPSADPFPLPLVDLQSLSRAEREVEALRLVAAEAQRPFDLASGPLLRARVLRLTDEDHIVQLTIHHIISDNWSTNVLVGEVAVLYNAFAQGQPAPLPELPLQYADFAVWQRNWLQGEVLENQLDYWRRQLADAPPLLELSTDRPRPAVQGYAGSYQSFTLPADLAQQLRALGQREGATLFMTLLAGFKILLARYSGQEDICVGTPIANRTRAEIEPLIGFFVNTLVLRTDLAGNPSFRAVLKRMREVALGAYAHQDVPFEMVVDAVQPERNLSHTPMFQVMFSLQNSTARGGDVADLIMSPVEAHSGTAKFDLTMFVVEEGEQIGGALEYSTDLFDATTITRLIGHFQNLLASIVAAPDQPVMTLPLLSEAERQQLLVEWNDTVRPFPHDRCFHELFEAQVARTPDAIAVTGAGTSLSYRDLNARANQLAHHLRGVGVGPERLVAVCLGRSPDLLVGLLGILKAGGAYLPLDPSYPAERLAFMLDDAQPIALLATNAMAQRLSAFSSQRLIKLDADWPTVAQQPATNLQSGVTAENLAYVIYTSGSTGQPKGALIVHRGLVNYLTWAVDAYAVAEGCGAPVHSSIAFDLTVTSMFTPLLAGRAVYLASEDGGIEPLSAALTQLENISLVKITPAHLELLGQQIPAAQAAGRTRAFIIGGENLLPQHVRFWQEHAPDTLLINEYGPTETVVGCCVYTAPPGVATGALPIGRPISNTQLYVLDRSMQPAPLGVVGELYIGGAGVARGYLNRPTLTAERFVTLPDLPTAGRLYKTGDLVRYRADGVLEFLGRTDDQVKLRGFRIELGEIEAALAQHPSVHEAAVIVREDVLGAKRLVAYIVAGGEAPAPDAAEAAVAPLRAFVAARLPDYMIPAAFVMLAELPLTPNGKVDRKALPAPDGARPDGQVEYVAPRTPAEQILAAIWAQVIGVERVGVYDNFFALGGDSIMSIQVIARAKQAGLRLTPRQLFEAPTVAGMAALLDGDPLVEQGPVSGPAPLTPAQQRFLALDLSQPQDWSQMLLLEVHQPLDRALLEQTMVALLTRHDALRLRYTHSETGWEQFHADVTSEAPLDWHDLAQLPDERQAALLTATASELLASLDLAIGPLLRAAYFDGGPGRSGRLLLVAHNLIMDRQSWRILLEDMQTVYTQLAGAGLRLPPKTASFQRWAQGLVEAAGSAETLAEQDYWLALAEQPAPALPIDATAGANGAAALHSVSGTLGVEETRLLLEEAPDAYRTTVGELVLTALAQTVTAWAGTQRLLIDIADQERPELLAGVDVSRTIGCFTTHYPLLLDLSDAADPGAAIQAVKEQWRSVPRNGVGYGLLRYLSANPDLAERLRAMPQADITFAYSAAAEQMLPSAAAFAFAPESTALAFMHGQVEPDVQCLAVSTGVASSQLFVKCAYNTALHRTTTIERLVQDYIVALQILIAHCQSSDASGHSAADFAEFGWSEDDLTDIMARITDSE
ncbi:MAG: amino acid adenylation domain-containing protein [Chloroflexales bacterium]|nr:amino acid adenylation domain-containing protein [Chloroflexales bacterium]